MKQYARCGEKEEIFNHVLFECPPALQTWALSRVPAAQRVFPMTSIFSNLDYFFWRLPKDHQVHSFSSILWYIWKVINDKVFNNLDRNPLVVLQLAESKAMAWEQAQENNIYLEPQISLPATVTSDFTGYRCFIDGSWKETYSFLGLGWYCVKDDVEGSMTGARNLHKSLSLIHSELEASSRQCIVW